MLDPDFFGRPFAAESFRNWPHCGEGPGRSAARAIGAWVLPVRHGSGRRTGAAILRGVSHQARRAGAYTLRSTSAIGWMTLLHYWSPPNPRRAATRIATGSPAFAADSASHRRVRTKG